MAAPLDGNSPGDMKAALAWTVVLLFVLGLLYDCYSYLS